MPKCADVQLQLGSDNLLQDIKDVAFFRKLQRFGSYTLGKAINNAMKQGGLPGIDAWICPSAVLARPLGHTSEGTGIQSSMYGSWWTLSPRLGGERFLLGQSSGFWCCVWISVSSFHSLGLVSEDVERRSSWSAGSQRATVPSFCVQRLQCMPRPLEHARQFRYKEGLVQRLVVQFLCIFAMVPRKSARVGA